MDWYLTNMAIQVIRVRVKSNLGTADNFDSCC